MGERTPPKIVMILFSNSHCFLLVRWARNQINKSRYLRTHKRAEYGKKQEEEIEGGRKPGREH